MRYYLDTEFDGFGGPLLSMALVREDGESMYATMQHDPDKIRDKWVKANVLPIMRSIPSPFPGAVQLNIRPVELSSLIHWFMDGDREPHIITDWPDDVRYFCSAIITGPGQMIALPSLSFDVERVDAYPTSLPNAVQHNAWWDAKALQHKIMGRN
ncbi:hypothetical protein [Sphingobium yanoikuyae]|uniref:hypothetical protein n=1 Tax=Sphingobium yanoikuyae TaxID=13690 RepID=UPI0035C735D1